MRYLALPTIFLLGLARQGCGQALREVPQRFAYLQPVGILVGVAQAGFEIALSRHSTIEFGGVGVYSREDGVEVYGGGPGVGVRRYFGRGEIGGLVIGARVDGVVLRGDNSDADRRFLGTGFLRERDEAFFAGFGGLLGYRWIATSGFFVEPMIGYEFFAGPESIVPGSAAILDDLGFSMGVGVGWAW